MTRNLSFIKEADGSYSKRVKVRFRIQRDEDNYPPVDWEGMWAIPLGADQYKIDNIPFYATSVAWGDVFSAEPGDPTPVAKELVEASGHSTIRVVAYDETVLDALVGKLAQLGCEMERANTRLLAVDVAPTVDVQSVLAFLDGLEAKEAIDYEVGCQAW